MQRPTLAFPPHLPSLLSFTLLFSLVSTPASRSTSLLATEAVLDTQSSSVLLQVGEELIGHLSRCQWAIKVLRYPHCQALKRQFVGGRVRGWGGGMRLVMEFLKGAACPDFPLECFQLTGGLSTGSKFLGIFTQHPINKMAMLLAMSYNWAY